MKTKSIRQSVVFKASPHEVYEALMDPKKPARFSGEEAHISRKVGGKIRVFGDYIEGIHLELIPDRKIVQSWRGRDCEPGYFSTVTFPMSKVSGGTKLEIAQVGVPGQFSKHISQGWKDYYSTPMKGMLENR